MSGPAPPRPTALDVREATALARDATDPLAKARSRFALPTMDGRPRAYLAGHSLGAQPHAARAAVEEVLEAWGHLGVDGWFASDRGWLDAERELAGATARIVGARPAEVTTANTLTVNLHLLLASFYRPVGLRTAVLMDAPTFPSDRYAVASHLVTRGLDPATELVVVDTMGDRDADVDARLEAAIEEHGDRLALTLLAGVNYATGRALDIGRLTAAAQRVGALAAWDLAHAAGNIPLALHDHGVDAAAWCTYKYLNSGPGALGQIFVHERHTRDAATPGLAGWWGNEPRTRFLMTDRFEPAAGADGWRISTPPMLSLAPIAASLAIFDEVGMTAIRRRSIELTGYLEGLVTALVPDADILTPRDPHRRGAQLSIRVANASERLAALEALDVIADEREPDILRFAPAPLYTSWHDTWRAAAALAQIRPRANGKDHR